MKIERLRAKIGDPVAICGWCSLELRGDDRAERLIEHVLSCEHRQLPSPPQWTTEPPTEPGCWWWAMQADHTKPSLVWIEVAAVTTTYGVERGKLVATDCFHPHYVPFKKITHWQRIPTPEPPK